MAIESCLLVCNDVWVAAVGEGQYSGQRFKDSLYLRDNEPLRNLLLRDVNGCDWCYNTTTSVYQLATVDHSNVQTTAFHELSGELLYEATSNLRESWWECH